MATPAIAHLRPLQSASRKLVFVRRIADLQPIKGNRHVEVAKIDGWSVVVMKEGIPKYNGQCGHVVKTFMKYGRVSQGIVFSLYLFTEIQKVQEELEAKFGNREMAVDSLLELDFTTTLGIKKYDSVYFDPAGSYGCERAQNVTGLFDRFGDTVSQITEKLDGLPMSVYHVGVGSEWYRALPQDHDSSKERPQYGVRGLENDYVQHEKSVFWIATKQQNIIDKLKRLGKNLAVQGELCGSSIMSNSMGFAEGQHRFYVFGIYDIDRTAWMSADKAFSLCRQLNLTHAPVEKAEGKGLLRKKREGLVFRLPNNTWGFKVIANSWLLEYGQHKLDQW
ncbi:DRB0094 family RNA ligase [Apiospora phragmitis]|uniref:DRB0094 family RNA ligase n=1 Tax=Apiospora phragmitis TaxID=2905665 RepID=A0ABR1VFA3_9PEZI